MPYRKSITTLNKERKLKWSRNAILAKKRKRMALGSTMRDCGGFTTDGMLGTHTVRILSYGDDENIYAITVDGKHRQARTERGILRCLAKMVIEQFQKQTTKGTTHNERK